MFRKKSLIILLALMTAGFVATACGEDVPENPGGVDKPTPDDKTPVVLTADNLKLTGVDSLVTKESGTTATFTMALDQDPKAEVTFQVLSDNPQEGSVSPATLQFNTDNWDAPQTVTITGLDDDNVDGDVNYNVVISYSVTEASTTGDGTASAKEVFKKEIPVTNQDDDVAAFEVNPLTGLITSESGTQATFSVVLKAKPASDVKISLTSSDEAEGSSDVKELTFTPDNWQEPQIVTVTGIDDELADGDKDYSIEVKVSGGDEAFLALPTQTVQVKNTDDEVASLNVSASSNLETAEDGTSVTFSVALSAKPASNVTMTVTSDLPTEGVPSPVELTFTPEDWNKDQQITVTGVSDDTIDGDVMYHITVGAFASDDPAFASIEPQSIEIKNIDKTVAGITYSPSEIMTSESGTTADISFVLTSKPTSNVKFTLQSDTPAEGIIGEENQAILEFSSENWNVAQIIKATGINDTTIDGNKAYHIELSNAESEDPNYKDKFGVSIPAINVDDDKPGITVSKAAEFLEVGEDGTPATFTIMLNNQPKDTVTIEFEPTEEFIKADVQQLIFTTENWNVPQTVTLTGVDDFYAEGDKNFTIQFTKTTSAGDPEYNDIQGLLGTVLGVLKDNDKAGLSLTLPDGDLTTSEDGAFITIKAALSAQPRADVTVAMEVSDATEGSIEPSNISFTPENWNVPQEFQIVGVDDDIFDGDIEYEFKSTLTSEDENFANIESESIKVTNSDNDKAEIHVSTNRVNLIQGGPIGSFTVSLTSAPLSEVYVPIKCEDCKDWAMLSAESVRFTPENWDAETINIKPIKFDEKPREFTIELGKAETEALGYVDIDPEDVSLSMIVFETKDFDYTGKVESIDLFPGNYKLEVWGAEGGAQGAYLGGKGGYSVGNFKLDTASTLYIVVGEKGSAHNNVTRLHTFNGGGYGTGGGGDGGGATHIALQTGELYTLSEVKDSVLIVAGAGGGGSNWNSICVGGYGGGLQGGDGVNAQFGYGGGQVEGGKGFSAPSTGQTGSFGLGGTSQSGNYSSGGSGGAGWYGGGSAGNGPGGGGSGYIKSTLTDAQTIAGNTSFPAPAGGNETGHTGHGYARISLVF